MLHIQLFGVPDTVEQGRINTRKDIKQGLAAAPVSLYTNDILITFHIRGEDEDFIGIVCEITGLEPWRTGIVRDKIESLIRNALERRYNTKNVFCFFMPQA